MALDIVFKTKNWDALSTLFHEMFKGWDAYINSEVAICRDPEKEEFHLILGKNEDHITIYVDSVATDSVSLKKMLKSYADEVAAREDVDSHCRYIARYLKNCYILPKEQTDAMDPVFTVEGDKMQTFVWTIPAEDLEEDPDNTSTNEEE